MPGPLKVLRDVRDVHEVLKDARESQQPWHVVAALEGQAEELLTPLLVNSKDLPWTSVARLPPIVQVLERERIAAALEKSMRDGIAPLLGTEISPQALDLVRDEVRRVLEAEGFDDPVVDVRVLNGQVHVNWMVK
jgi:hypothetical protein